MQFEYKEIDEEGLETLNAIEKANKFNRWMYSAIRPSCKGKILEVGSGIGNISHFFFEEKEDIILSDIRQNYCEKLRNKFPQAKVLNFDLVSPDFDTEMKEYFGYFDSIFALNVLEHIENDRLALSNAKKLLKEGGTLIILVPAYQKLYNRFDKELMHFRRYTASSLCSVFRKAGFSISDNKYFNLIGIAGWLFSGAIQKNKTIPAEQMRIYNACVPMFKIFDNLVLHKIGLSVIVVGTNTATKT
ncbi:MAG: class I SAM-dependent methyltransferase [Bacteroidia bacterium]|jgi:SAM-dependent methyltransferase